MNLVFYHYSLSQSLVEEKNKPSPSLLATQQQRCRLRAAAAAAIGRRQACRRPQLNGLSLSWLRQQPCYGFSWFKSPRIDATAVF
jgi:hypothetical protein